MRILSIDPGTKSLGWSIIDGDFRNQRIVGFGLFRPKSDRTLLAIMNFADEIIERYEPDVIVIESSFFGLNAKSSFKIGEARAAVIIAAQKHNIAVEEISPKQAKLSITGNGNASKKQVKYMVEKLYNIKVPSIDSSDAISIGISFLIRSGRNV